jgi:hypothetical protein
MTNTGHEGSSFLEFQPILRNLVFVFTHRLAAMSPEKLRVKAIVFVFC